MAHEESYQLYLQRFERALGQAEVGAFVSGQGGVVKKLSPAEFAEKWQDFIDIRSSYEAMIGRGLTVDNVLQRELRQRAAELVVELPDALK